MKKRGDSIWKIIETLAIIAGLGITGYMMLKNERRVEEARAIYQKHIDDIKQA